MVSATSETAPPKARAKRSSRSSSRGYSEPALRLARIVPSIFSSDTISFVIPRAAKRCISIAIWPRLRSISRRVSRSFASVARNSPENRPFRVTCGPQKATPFCIKFCRFAWRSRWKDVDPVRCAPRCKITSNACVPFSSTNTTQWQPKAATETISLITSAK